MKFTMSDETPPASTAWGVGVAVGGEVVSGVGVEPELHAAMEAAIAKSAVRSITSLRTKGQAMSGNGSRRPR